MNEIESGKDPITVAGLIEALSLLRQDQEVYIFDHRNQQEIPFSTSKHVDTDRDKNRIVIDV